MTSCPRPENLYLYLEGELGPYDAAKLEEHLEGCAACRDALAERRVLHEAFTGLPPFEVPEDFARSVMDSLPEPEVRKAGWLAPLIAAVSALSIGLLGFNLFTGTSVLEVLVAVNGFFGSALARVAPLLAKTLKLLNVLLDVAVGLVRLGFTGLGDVLAGAGASGHRPRLRPGGPPDDPRRLRSEAIPPRGRAFMTKKILTLAVLGLFALAGPAAAQARVGAAKDITVSAGETQDKVFSLGGHVVIEGNVREDVMVIGGSITVSGEVGQSVVGIGSHIVIRSTAKIGEDLAALGGTLEKEPGCSVAGDTIYFQTRELGDRLFKDGLLEGALSLSIIPIIIVVKLVVIFLWLIVAVMGAALFPKPLAFAAGEIRKHFWPAFGTGLAAILVFTMLVFFAALLSFILIGIPIALALGVAGFIVKVFGRLAVFYLLGASVLGGYRSRTVSAMGAVLMGLLLFSLAGFVPILGFLFTLVMNAVGWGIAIRTKFGSRENWFVKTPVC